MAQALAEGRRLSYLSIALALLEGVLSLAAAAAAGSIALLSFGLDSLIEVGSSSAVLWGMALRGEAERQRREKLSLQAVGAFLLCLALYVTYASIAALVRHEHPQRSLLGIGILVASLVAMLWLRNEKRRVAAQLGNDALAADAKQTEFCSYLSLIALAGVSLNALFGLWWMDALAAVLMVPVIVREGVEALQGKACAHC